jgi:hypothetical protein
MHGLHLQQRIAATHAPIFFVAGERLTLRGELIEDVTGEPIGSALRQGVLPAP